MTCCSATTEGVPCTTDAAGTLACGCAHEHISENPVCAAHAAQFRDGITRGVVRCIHCRDCSEPHTCWVEEIAWRPFAVSAS
jgi:hypothetical protein